MKYYKVRQTFQEDLLGLRRNENDNNKWRKRIYKRVDNWRNVIA
jgi:hypothetical protein